MPKTLHAHQALAVDQLRNALRSGVTDITVKGQRFRVIPGFGRYMIGDFGTVFSSIREPRFLSSEPNRYGYPNVALMDDKGRRHRKAVHRLVAEAFLGSPPIGKEIVNHKNGVRTDAYAENLEWASYSENNMHAITQGLRGRNGHGEAHYASKLTEDQVREIRSRVDAGEMHRVIAKQMGIVRQTVTKIVNGHTWRRAA